MSYARTFNYLYQYHEEDVKKREDGSDHKSEKDNVHDFDTFMKTSLIHIVSLLNFLLS